MSNTKRAKAPKLRPPEDIRALADAYECGHCIAGKELRHDGLAWRLSVAHDPTCPVYLGLVDRAPQLADAMRSAGITSALAVIGNGGAR